MAYTNAGNASFRMTSLAHGSSTILGKIRYAFEVIVTDEPLMADASNTPESRPVDNVDARLTADFLDGSSVVDYTDDAADVVVSMSEANGSGTAVHTLGELVPRSVRGGNQRRGGGNPYSQDFYLEGALTNTLSV